MNNYVTGIYPIQRRLKPLRSRPTAILSSRALEKLAIDTTSAQRDKEHHDSNIIRECETKNNVKLRVAKQIPIEPNILHRVLVASTEQRNMYFEQYE